MTSSSGNAQGASAWRSLARPARLFLLGLALLLAAACYKTDEEIIDARSAVFIPGLARTHTNDMNPDSKTIISAVPGTNDYRFQDVGGDNPGAGYLRIIPLRGDIHLVQVKFDGDVLYYLYFYEYVFDTGSDEARYFPMMPSEDTAPLAQRHNVRLEYGEEEHQLYGGRGDILAFLLAHANLSFESAFF